MDKLTSVSNLMRIFRERGLAPNRKLGQSFLVDASILHKTVDAIEVSSGDHILEIGPGAGTLTEPLAEKVRAVMAIELDRGLFSLLEDRFANRRNVRLVHADVLRCDLEALLESWLPPGCRLAKVVSNLPYCITTPVIGKFLRLRPAPEQIIFTVQKELAERLTASPGSRTYGRLTIMVNYFSRPEQLFTIGSSAFWPKPKVDSAVMRFRPTDDRRLQVMDEELMFAIIKKAFHQRRRMLRNSLAPLIGVNCLSEAMAIAHLDSTLRPERLSVEDFTRLTNAVVTLEEDGCESPILRQ